VFMYGLRYPWPPVADHAAEALVFLNDQEVVPLLVTLLKKPDPAAPAANSAGRSYRRELVQIDHSANCMMCHAPALSSSDPARGPVPGVVAVGKGRGAGGSGGGGGGGRWPGGSGGSSLNSFFVRADVAYLRQDFSIDQPVTDPTTGSDVIARFDYLVRVRPAKPEEISAHRQRSGASTSFAQRDAVLFALRELTGKDAGPTTGAWLALYPKAESDVAAAARASMSTRSRSARQPALPSSN